MTRQTSYHVPLLCGVLLAALGCQGDGTGSKKIEGEPTGPIAAVKETVVQAGTVDYGTPRDYFFAISNAGDQPLSLKVARKSCFCADVEVPAEKIPPGGEGKVKVRWAPIPGNVGPYTLSTDLQTNDPQNPVIHLEVKGLITPVVQISPENWSFIDFGNLRPGQSARRELKICSALLPAFELDAATDHPGLLVTKDVLPAGTMVNGSRIESGYVVGLKTSDQLPPGYFRADLRLTIKAPGHPERTLTLAVYGDVENGIFQVRPDQVRFEKPLVTEADTKKVRVEFFVPSDQEQVEVARPEPSFLVVGQPARLRPGLWEFTVSIPKDNPEAAKYQADGFFEGQVFLKVSGAPGEVPVRVKWDRP